ncbi:LysR family transcriptional regulator [Candidimonas nitroreducens]|uniref:LysR family transcriptional regulator n=1 Tax=Candidimonas nitroreducens TaxID=683354 RepID=A0A225LZC0_9BURK|nr:LysR family transcriptional regulator [Candidimonas nitroreducens]OWT54495.1 LysR family transcriptional regulator [Candidimonas nitroreducens]
MNLSFKDLEYFLAVIDHRGVGRAAAALGVTQPTLSKAIRRVEEESGLVLFDRSTRRMALSATGQVFLEHARKLQADYADAMRHAAELGAGRTGLLRVGATGATMTQFVLPTLAQLLPRRPALRVHLSVELSDRLLTALAEGAIDLAVAPTYVNPDPALAQIPLRHDQLRIVAREQHPLRYRRRLGLADLCDQLWILPHHDSMARRKLDALFTHANLRPPQAALEVDFSSTAGLELVRDTDMLTIVSESYIRRSRFAGIAALSLGQKAELPLQLSLLTRHEAIWSPLMHEFRDALRTRAEHP